MFASHFQHWVFNSHLCPDCAVFACSPRTSGVPSVYSGFPPSHSTDWHFQIVCTVWVCVRLSPVPWDGLSILITLPLNTFRVHTASDCMSQVFLAPSKGLIEHTHKKKTDSEAWPTTEQYCLLHELKMYCDLFIILGGYFSYYVM